MAQQIDSTKIGQLAARYAPDVPLELVGAVFKTESSYGSNAAAYVPNSSGAIGPGQILSKALGAKYGNFEAYMPGGNPRDPEQATIAALKKVSADWKRSGDSIEKFSELYFGGGRDANGNTALNHYVPKLLAAIKGQSNDNQYWKLVEGAMGGTARIDTGTPSNTLGENRLAWMMENGGPATPSLAPESTYATAATSTADQLIESITGSYQKLADAKTDLARVEGTEKLELAKQTEKMLSAMGLNLNDSGSQITKTAAALQSAMDTLRAGTSKLATDRQSPFFNIFDTVTKGGMSRIHQSNIAGAATEVKTLSNALQELQTNAAKQIALQPKVSQAAIEQEVRAKGAVFRAEAEINANKIGLQQEVRDERARLEADKMEARRQIDSANLDLKRARLEFDAAKAVLPKQLTFTQQIQQSQQKAEEEMFLDTAQAMGMNSEEYVRFLTKNKNLAAHMVGSDGKLPIPLVFAKANLGKYTPAQKKMFDSAYGQFAGWARPNSSLTNGPAGIDYAPDGMEEAVKSAKTPAERDALNAAMIEAVAFKKRDFILNRGTQQDQEVNPYAANFDRVGEFAKLPEFVRANPLVDRVSKSALYQELAAKNAKSPIDKRSVADQDVIEQAYTMIQSNKLSPQDAAKQVSDYFKAQVAMNNYAKQFKEIGLPEQETYRVPVVPEGRRIEFKVKSGKDGKVTPEYNMVDLTSEQKTLAVLLTRDSAAAYTMKWLAGLVPFVDLNANK